MPRSRPGGEVAALAAPEAESTPARGAGGLRRVVGWAFVAASLGFVAWKCVASRLWSVEGLWTPASAAFLVAAALVYGVGGLLLSTAWWRLLRWFGEADAGASICHGIYGRSQVGKYLPGNLAHYVQRHAMGRKVGFRHAALAGATIAEGLSGLLAGGCIATVGLLLLGAAYPEPWRARIWGALGLLLALIAVGGLVWRGAGMRRRLGMPEQGGPAGLGLLAQALALHAAFLLLAGLEVACAAWVLGEPDGVLAALSVIPVFAIAVLAGFVTPGAPAGTGVREAVLVLGLSPTLGETASLAVAIGFRAVTTLGDVVFFGLSHWFPSER